MAGGISNKAKPISASEEEAIAAGILSDARRVVCASCRWYQSTVPEAGQCRKRAPLADLFGVPVWPMVNAGDFCGEFERGKEGVEG